MEAILVTGLKELTTSNRKNINHDANIVLEKELKKLCFQHLIEKWKLLKKI